MYKWFLVGRYLRTKVIALFAMIAVTLCVAMMLVVLSVMGGFLDMVKERSRGLLSDVVIDNGTLQGFPYYEEFIAYLHDRLGDVVADATPVIQNYGVLRSPTSYYTKPVRIVGIRLDEYCKVNDFKSSLFYDRYYPGTTTLKPQKQPIAGSLGSMKFDRLPPEFEAANQRWHGAEPDQAEVMRYDQSPFAIFTGAERVFASPMDLDDWKDLSAQPDIKPRWVGEDRHGVIVGSDVLFERGDDGRYPRYFKKGEAFALMVLPMSEKGTVSPDAPTLPVRYADDSRTGVYEIDSICTYIDFDYIQKKLDMNRREWEDGTVSPARVSQILISTRKDVDFRAARDRIEEAWEQFRQTLTLDPMSPEARMISFVQVQTWEQMQARYIAAIEKERNLVTILFGVVMLVAVVLIGLVFWMIVEKKTRDIGILKSMGASSPGIAGVFVVYAAAIGVIGAVCGSVLGGVFVHFINDVQDLLARINPSMRVWSPDVYSFDKIPNVVKPFDVAWIAVGAVAASILGALIPAIHASAVWPVRALRWE